ncbi:hypothetical protein [Sabulicella rubraurantiaca]|uniref:hypothetical protein n=1 Tax=Sabulicella rubraurantiaca TaxID=2811429 RepID=UPI001A95A3A5|nr:hypothetical protein [Sabulicella rubraurantiaca]
MLQSTLNVPLEVKPESCSRLSALIEALRQREDTGPFGQPDNFSRVMRDIPTLHFMSMSVFTAAEYDPIFILEANFDGQPGVFWGQLEAAFGPDLREMLRCCKRPLDEDGPLYDAVTASDSRAPLAPYLEARTQRPSVFHHGNRGLTRDRILQEAALFVAVREELDDPGRPGPSPYRGRSATEVHALLRKAMVPAHPWLGMSAPPRISRGERLLDILRLVTFAVLLLLAFSLPAIVVAALMPWKAYVLLLLLVATATGLLIYAKRAPLPGTETSAGPNLTRLILPKVPAILGIVAAYVVVAALVLTPLVSATSHLLAWLGAGNLPATPGDAFWPVARAVLLGLLGLLLVILPGLVLWLRYLERHDSSHDAPHVDERLLREMVRREDWVAQNHMGSIVLIKPGVLRSIIIRAGHLGLGLVLRVVATDGYLGTMRTVHFAHWAFLNNGSRLLFFSNFDHSWDSYLDDFIEKAAGGLTLAWGCGVGFPPTRFLIYDGARHGRRFKNWALASRAVSRFWYSAYPTLTVDQIERNNRIADGLRRPELSEVEARAWISDL